MTIMEKERALREFEKLVSQLEEMGVAHTVREPHSVLFDNENGECMAFPSQTYDGKLVILYQAKERYDTADEVLKACGVTSDVR